MQVFHSLNLDSKADATGLPKVYPVTIRDCNNTASEVFAIEVSIPANDWGDGELICLEWFAEFRNLAGGSPTLATKIYFGSDSLTLASADGVGSGLARIPYRLKLWRVGSSIWVPGWESGYGYDVAWHGGAINAVTGSDQFSTGKRGGEMTSIGFSTEKALKFSVQFSAAGSGLFYTVKGAKVWKI